MTADGAGLLTLVQWLSPAFPLGGFAYSHGLEAAMAAGQVRDADDLRLWVGDVILRGSGRIDATALVAALRPGADHAALSAEMAAMAASVERLRETAEQGRAFTRTVNALTCADDADAVLPVAVGRAAARLGVAPATVVTLYLNGFATQLVMAAVRFLPLGQTEGQAVIAALAPVIAAATEQALAADLTTVGSAAFGADLAAMAHEALQPRMFIT
jgi:urease accessory protein